VFNLYGNQKLTEWKKFRDSIETSDTPLEDLADLWRRAPFVNAYLNPHNPEGWPDPWHLIIDGKFDDLAISLGMLYTIKLTDRFKNTQCDIYQITDTEIKYPLIVDQKHVLNWNYGTLAKISDLDLTKSRVVWSKHDQI
jgi:hypothetical protein